MQDDHEMQSPPPGSDSAANAERPSAPWLSRRSALLLGGGLVIGAGAGAGSVKVLDDLLHRASAGTSTGTASTTASGASVRRYRTTMAVVPTMRASRVGSGALAAGLLCTTPNVDGISRGVIMDDTTEPVWIEPSGRGVEDLRVQRYQGKPVLTYWSGTVETIGYGVGSGTILDTNYRTVATVQAGAGLSSDLHEFELTADGTALVTAYPTVAADLRSVGGPQAGWLLDCHVQEIEIATGRVLLNWRASDHIALTESYETRTTSGRDSGTGVATPYDAFHVNAISAWGNTLLVSARHTHALYQVSRTTGAVDWRLGGKKSDFRIPSDAAFAWQHHARWRSSTQLSMFDNHVKVGDGHSSGLILDVDQSAKTVTLVHRYTYRNHLGHAEGSAEPLSNGNVLVGWGATPYATEFDGDGTALLELSGLGSSTYRCFRESWTATPFTAPAVAATRSAGKVEVAMSWNGATEVRRWRILAGSSSDTLSSVLVIDRAGFETTATIDDASVVRAEALDGSGAVLDRSLPATV